MRQQPSPENKLLRNYPINLEKAMAPHSSTLAWKSHGWRSLVGYSPWSLEESDTTERLHFHFSCIGEGNGNPLQCSCLENLLDGGAWWAAVCGIAQSRTWLKRLSSSSSNPINCMAASLSQHEYEGETKTPQSSLLGTRREPPSLMSYFLHFQQKPSLLTCPIP